MTDNGTYPESDPAARDLEGRPGRFYPGQPVMFLHRMTDAIDPDCIPATFGVKVARGEKGKVDSLLFTDEQGFAWYLVLTDSGLWVSCVEGCLSASH